MKNKTWISALLILIGTLGTATVGGAVAMKKMADSPQWTTARIQISWLTKDLGVVAKGESLSIDCSLLNVGRRRLVINQSNDQCGCADPIQRTFLVRPGDSVDVPISLETGWSPGVIEKITTFTTNDPSLPKFALTLRAKVQ